jgi:hypothetical protein
MSSEKEKIVRNIAFVERLTEACGTAEPVQISRLLNISYQAAKNYLSGYRYPSTEILISLADRTEYSIHWLLTGKGNKIFDDGLDKGTPILTGQVESFVRKICVEVINETFGGQPRVVVLPPASLREEKVEENSPAYSEHTGPA